MAAPGLLANDVADGQNALSAMLVSSPSAWAGTVTVQADGGFVFTPAADYCGPAFFSYRAHSGARDSSITTATITVTCVNDPPAFTKGAPTSSSSAQSRRRR